jgi:hypothetical protein
MRARAPPHAASPAALGASTPAPPADGGGSEAIGYWQDMAVLQSNGPGWKTTDMGWGVHPEGIRKILGFIQVGGRVPCARGGGGGMDAPKDRVPCGSCGSSPPPRAQPGA